ncbi:cupin domain-containing protein [Streptomyces prunicolor]|uniref:cupin domain-containing protein n=1 Tax=Streptomyces prunicolor TaxID=67348 RepID=UPI0033E9D761
MTMAYLAQPEQQQRLEWLDGGEFAVLLDAAATGGQLTVGRFSVAKGEAPPYHKHTREDEVFMLIKGSALLWCDDEEMELTEGGIVFLPRNVPHGYRITSDTADLLMICTSRVPEHALDAAGRVRRAGLAHAARPERQAVRPRRSPGCSGRAGCRCRPGGRHQERPLLIRYICIQEEKWL